MEHFPEERYYKLNRFVLSLTGLWPYQSKWSARLVRAIIITMLLASAIFQLLSLFTSNITANFIIDMVPAFVPVIGSLSQMYARIGHTDKLRDLFEHMWNDWRLRKTTYETKIMQKHAETSRLLTFYYLLMQYIAVTGYNAWLFLPEILDIVSPINESRPRILPFKAEFFVDEGRYFNIIRSHICIVICIISLIFIAVSTLYIALTQHVCGMCELLGFVGMIEFYHTIPFLMDIIGLVLATSLALTQMLTSIGDNERTARSISVAILTLIHLFISNYMGQRVTDTTSSACEKV
ncbi:PREDICTED: uncharacterized protein LOC108773853 [Cyphomyrmex costatus]|uniref:uncharacterized protein LOC108773853 n=1 Tax=Cyphomyrmex costatus TaxID=456900 RepID=UPI0008523ED6|nr:PREDICTED: uncharacterized protein LOC108773853 [Cyphomyrmex costatus]